jgi:para-aminobenzoate synthetase component I
MSMFQPEVLGKRTNTLTRCNHYWERSRLEWRVSDSGDPAQVAADYLAAHGLGLPLAAVGQTPTTERHCDRLTCGAAIFVSAHGAASMVSTIVGSTSPAGPVPDLVIVIYAHGEGFEPAEPVEPLRVGPFAPSWSTEEHAAAVRSVRAAIARGDVYQVNVVGHASAPYVGDPIPALRRVSELPGARYGGVLTGEGWAIASASPELLVSVRGGIVETAPIKGTRPATAAGRRELLASTKERAEHIMIVDLERNDLAQVAEVGTVKVPTLFDVRRWCDLWQAESRVTARLAHGVDLADLLRAVCPGGSVTGAPKRAALAEIAGVEPVGRGPSMGALGWLDADGLELGLTIRTVAADGERLHVWAGGGITWDSDPDPEVAEAAAKAAPLIKALQA